MKCYKCGTLLSDESKFCPLCGAKNDGTPNFCTECGNAVAPDAQFCEACGAKVKKIQQEEEKTDLSTSMADIAIEVTEKVLENIEGDNHSTHFEEIQNAQRSQSESLTQSAAPGKPQTSTHGSSTTQAQPTQIKRSAVSAQQTSGAPATRKVSVPVNQATAPVQIPVSGGNLGTKIGEKLIDTATDVVKEGAKKLSVGKTIAIWAAVVTFLVGAATACLSFFVSPPEDTVTTLVESVEELNYEKMLGCFDKKSEKQIGAVVGLTGNLFGALTGIDMEYLLDLAPSLAPYLEVPELGISDAETILYADCSTAQIMEYCIAANNGESIPTGYLADNEIVSFLMEYKITLPGLENLIAKAAIVKVTLADGEVGYFPLINEGWGDWRIPIMDMVNQMG